MDALAWAKRAEGLGAGEICLNSIDADGTTEGYELTITSLISRNVTIPVIASGGAGRPEHIRDVFLEADADAALIASMVHYKEYTVAGIKQFLKESGIPVRERA
jgi:cyclase